MINGLKAQMQFNMNLIGAVSRHLARNREVLTIINDNGQLGTCISAVAAWYAVSLEDRMPRRSVLIWGTLACSFLLAANAGLSAAWAGEVNKEVKNLSLGRAGAAFYFLFGVVYAFTVCHLPFCLPC